jgi:hypothetical protein
MPRIPPFALGHIVGAVAVGLIAGAFFDFTAMLVFSGSLLAGAMVSILVCRWRPGLDAEGWKLWLASCLANPLFVAAVIYSLFEYECLLGWRKGWSCLFADVGPFAAGLACVPPLAGLIWRWWRSRALASS